MSVIFHTDSIYEVVWQVSEGLKLFQWNFFLFFLSFYQSTALSSRAVDGHQMYSEGSVVGKASTVGI